MSSVYQSGAQKRKKQREMEDALKRQKPVLAFFKPKEKSANQHPDVMLRLQHNAARRGLKVKTNVPSDGNCFYHCISDQLKRVHHSEVTALELRQRLVEFMKQIVQSDDPLAEHLTPSYIDKMSHNGQWVDAVAVQSMARMLCRDIVIVTSSEFSSSSNYFANTIPGGTNGSRLSTKDCDCLLLGNLDELHYVSMEPIAMESVLLEPEAESFAPDPLHSNSNRDSPSSEINKSQEEPKNSESPTSEFSQTTGKNFNNLGDCDISASRKLPSCWRDDQYNFFLRDNSWLFVGNEKIGCSICKKCQDLGLSNGPRDWASGLVGPNGPDKSAQQRSLRKKIYIHRDSENHRSCVAALETRKKEALTSALSFSTAAQHEKTCKVFRTAYLVAKNDRPYTDHADLIQLQELNGCNLGRILHSNVTCTDIIDHVADQMRKTIVKHVVENECLISILLDEGTNIAKLSCLIVYIRVTLDEMIGPVTFFFDIIQLEDTHAAGIMSSLINCLTNHGFRIEYLVDHWIGLCVDGASVMMGKKTGLATRLKEKFPLIMSWHCSNHRLELSIHDAIKCCSEINHFKIFIDTLYATYSMSPKNLRELAECAKELEAQISIIGRVLDTRWVASSYRTVRATWKSYPALHAHFIKKATDSSLDGKERSKFSGLSKTLECSVFVKNLGLMCDALEELSDLSLGLQRSDINMVLAHKLITRQIEVFSARKETSAHYYALACKAEEEGSFQGITLTASRQKIREINRATFYQALADSMTSRLLCESERNVCESVAVLDSDTWPADFAPDFGEVDLRLLCERFSYPFSGTKLDFRQLKISKDIPNSIRKLRNRINTIAISTAECERGFSKMNIIATRLRAKLGIKHMASLMFLSLSGPPISEWDPLPYVKSWLIMNRREASSTHGPAKTLEKEHDKIKGSLWKIL